MKNHWIHPIQKSFRVVLDCMAKPGTIGNLASFCREIDLDVDCFQATLMMMLMVLDTETSFHIVSKRGEGVANFVRHLTNASMVALEEADYIFVLKDAKAAEIEKTIEKAKTGTLNHPDHSATLLFETGGLSLLPQLQLKGPGIEHEKTIAISLNGNWIEKRAEQNAGYPLGVDAIYVDAQSNLLCLPRTTTIQKMR